PANSGVWRSLFEEWLNRAVEPSVFGQPGERYRLVSGPGSPWFALRIEVGTGEAVAQKVSPLRDRDTEPEVRRPLPLRELERIRWLVERSGFWALPSPNPKSNVGLDGAHYLFEARVGDRYHLVRRRSPHRDGFARLCRHFKHLFQAVVPPRWGWLW